MDTVPIKQKSDNVFTNNYTITGGAMMAVAAKAAAASLLLRISYDTIYFRVYDDTVLHIPVRLIPHPENNAIREYAVLTSGLQTEGLAGISEIHVSVERVRRLSDIPEKVYIQPEYINLYMDGGPGVAVNQERCEFGPAGYYSIQKETRNLVFQTVADVIKMADVMPLLMIKVSAVSFQNQVPRNCIIRGTGGFVVPTSQNDILREIAASLQEQYERGIRNVIAVPGNSGHKYVQDQMHIAMANCVRCRNYIGSTVDMAANIGMENFLLVGNPSKLIRLAAGIMDTHSWIADGRREVLSLHTVLAGGTIAQSRIIQDIATTDHMLSQLTEWGLRDQVMTSVCAKIADYMRNRVGGGTMKVGVVPVHYYYGILGQTPEITGVLAAVSREHFALSLKKQ